MKQLETSQLLDRLSELKSAQTRLAELEAAYEIVQKSKFARLRTAALAIRDVVKLSGVTKFSRLFLPKRSATFENGDIDLVMLTKRLASLDGQRDALLSAFAQSRIKEGADPFSRWLRANEARAADVERMKSTADVLIHKPTFSILMPTYDTRADLLRAAIESVFAQAYPFWELCIADDASTKLHVREILQEYAQQDHRIKLVLRESNEHISAATNSALAIATGEFIALLDHDDLLTPDALFEMALAINRDPNCDMLYSDEDKIDDNGVLREPYFKPDWSPDSFLSRMYTSHLGTYRRTIAMEIGGFRKGFEGSQDHDFVLRFTERTGNIVHVPKILYHWRMHEGSTAASAAAKGYASIAGQRAVSEAIERRNEPGAVVNSEDLPGVYIVRYKIKKKEPVTIIVPTRDHGDDVDRCLSSIFEHESYGDFEILLVDNQSTDEASLQTFSQWATRERRVRVVPYDAPFNFSKLNNFAASLSQAQYVLFLNNDTEIITDDWLEAMVEQAQRPSIGAVGALLLYPDDTVQHAGVVIGLGGVAGHTHKSRSRSDPGYFGMLRAINNVSAVTAACAMMRRDVFFEVGGYDEGLQIAFNDVDLCLKLREAGYNNVFLPHVKLYHFESKSRGLDDTAEKRQRFVSEVSTMKSRWETRTRPDPYYSPHLSLEAPGYTIGS